MSRIVRKLMQRVWKESEKGDNKRIAMLPKIDGVYVEGSMAYLLGNEAMHQLNLYRPEGAQGLLPVVVSIHGGGWMYGDKDLNSPHCMYLASKGYAVMGMSYRLLPHTNLMGQVQDIFDSLHWLERYGPSRHFDLSRVLLTGDSAGGHFTGLIACVQQSKALQEIYQVKPVGFSFGALAISHGVCDVNDLWADHGAMGERINREMRRMMFGNRPEKAPWFGHASFTETAPGLSLPPILVIGSDPDPFARQSKALCAYLEETGQPHEALHWTLDKGPHLSHVFHILHPEWEESIQTNDRMLAFFDEAVAYKGK